DHDPGHRHLHRPALMTEFEAALEAVAYFTDVKSPYTIGHSWAVADLPRRPGQRGDVDQRRRNSGVGGSDPSAAPVVVAASTEEEEQEDHDQQDGEHAPDVPTTDARQTDPI